MFAASDLSDHVNVIDSEGNLWGFGDNSFGILGLGTEECLVVPPKVEGIKSDTYLYRMQFCVDGIITSKYLTPTPIIAPTQVVNAAHAPNKPAMITAAVYC